MVPGSLQIVKQQVEKRLLPVVRKPARYIGGEVYSIRKDLNGCAVRVGLCFPDIYEIAMSHTGLAILYEALNRMEDVAAERIFAPWTDAEEVMRAEGIPLFSLESKLAAGGFDILGFSLTNELCYTNLLNMLDLSGLAVRRADRSERDPLIVVGGQSANSAEPIAPFVDLFVLGQGEEAAVEMTELYRSCKQAGKSKQAFLLQAARTFDFVYVPSLYEFEYENSRIKSFSPKASDLPVRFKNAGVKNLDTAVVPAAPIVPFVQAVHDRISIEIMRGCPGRCRFCQAGFCRRPLRYRSVDRIVEIAKQQYEATGFENISLLSLSTGDYPWLAELLDRLNEYFVPRHVGISVPSLRVRQQLELLPKLTTSVRKGGLTIAVEAGGETLRRVINKPITDEDLFAAVRAAYEAGFRKVKLYFMVGHPGESETDVLRIVDLAQELALLRRPIAGGPADVNATVSWLVPKPHTPFGWLGQRSREYFAQARKRLLDRKHELKARYIHLKFHDIDRSILECVMGRGDRRMADVIETAWRNGAAFDLWDEGFDFEIWKNAFTAHGMNIEAEAARSYGLDEVLPWGHLGGPGVDYLKRHYSRAIQDIPPVKD